ncbi:hypothetical protein PT974_00422 [Cladobotryum mycophilum]|uniref:Uncharacterized protein n=1 Tax=Cladobotryum mycophilum TaxID=491253 RepID=A0ABR0T0V8_9HYPO
MTYVQTCASETFDAAIEARSRTSFKGHSTVEQSGGRVLPAPLIFPPVVHFVVSEEIAASIKEEYGSSILRTMAEENEEE